MRRWGRPLLAELTRTGTSAMRSRGRKLLARLGSPVSAGDRRLNRWEMPLTGEDAVE